MINLKKTGHGLVSSVLKQGLKECSYEHNTEPSASIKDGEPLDHASFWKTSAPRNCVLLFYMYGLVILHFSITIQILLLHGHAWKVSHWFLTMEPGRPCGICGGQSGNEANLSQHTSFFPCQLSFHQCSILIYNHYHIKGWHMKCISGLKHQQAQSHNPSIFIILLHANI